MDFICTYFQILQWNKAYFGLCAGVANPSYYGSDLQMLHLQEIFKRY
jgi:hypothetical protein